MFGESESPTTGDSLDRRMVCRSLAAGTSHTHTAPSRVAASTHRPSAEKSRDATSDFAPRRLRTRRAPTVSSTRTHRSEPATATNPLGLCAFILVTAHPVSISHSRVVSLNRHARAKPSAPPVTSVLFAPSVSTAVTAPSCAGTRGAAAAAASAPWDWSAMFQMDFAPPRKLSCRLGFLASAILARRSSSVSFARRRNAPLCAPLCRLYRCTSPPAVPTTAKLPHALMATHSTAFFLASATPSLPTRAGGARTCSPNTPSASRHVYARGSPS